MTRTPSIGNVRYNSSGRKRVCRLMSLSKSSIFPAENFFPSRSVLKDNGRLVMEWSNISPREYESGQQILVFRWKQERLQSCLERNVSTTFYCIAKFLMNTTLIFTFLDGYNSAWAINYYFTCILYHVYLSSQIFVH